jgi:hypothetical protein
MTTMPFGVEPALLRPRADVVFHAWNLVRDFGNVIIWEYDATEGDPSAVLTTTYVQADCRGNTRQRAYELADQVRRRLKAMPWDYWDEAIVSEVTTVSGPRWLPDENAAPRYVARYAIYHHPRQRRG